MGGCLKYNGELTISVGDKTKEDEAAFAMIPLVSRVCRITWFTGHPSQISSLMQLGVCGDGKPWILGGDCTWDS